MAPPSATNWSHQNACVMMLDDQDRTKHSSHRLMPSLQIRELPADVYEGLAFRAERNGRSLAQQAIVELRRAQEAGRQDRRREVLEHVKGRAGRRGLTAPEEYVREDRQR